MEKSILEQMITDIDNEREKSLDDDISFSEGLERALVIINKYINICTN